MDPSPLLARGAAMVAVITVLKSVLGASGQYVVEVNVSMASKEDSRQGNVRQARRIPRRGACVAWPA